MQEMLKRLPKFFLTGRDIQNQWGFFHLIWEKNTEQSIFNAASLKKSNYATVINLKRSTGSMSLVRLFLRYKT